MVLCSIALVDPSLQSRPARKGSPQTLRYRTTRAVRAEVAAIAMDLFLEQGFDKTTVDQIASESGLSRTSFFRYFATKDDVVLGTLDELGHQVLDALVARPLDEPAWQALRRALDVILEQSSGRADRGLSEARLLSETPSLKARHLGRQVMWHDLLVPEVARRLEVENRPHDPRPRAVVAAALACLNAAFDVWISSNGTLDLPTLFDLAMSALTE
jgi:AcrR family transcriptional regulator